MIATTAAGGVKGVVSETNGQRVLQYRSIPYAAPPTGRRRFLPAQPTEPWSAVRDATTFGPTAPQPALAIESLFTRMQLPQHEDCLTLTVTTPDLDGARPVMVWIHGGGFTTGTGATPFYDGAALAAQGDVVVVSINYRLGALGFLHLAPILGDEYADSGCAGLADQITALEWVRDNIAGFGGDPARVTIFGESAGGMSVGSLLGSPRAAGLFSTAVAQSGAAHNASNPDSAADITMLVLGELGLNEDSAEGILDMSPDALLQAQNTASLKLASARGITNINGGGLPLQPVCGTPTLPQHPLDAIRGGSSAAVRVVAGSTTEEWRIFALMMQMQGDRKPLDRDRLAGRLERTLGPAGRDMASVYLANRADASPDEVYGAVVTDFVFRIPALRLLEAHLAHSDQAYLYEFGHRSTAFDGALGACHGIDIPFVFNNLAAPGVSSFVGELGDAEAALATETSAAWLAAAHGDEPWPRYDTSERVTRRFGGARPGLHADPAGDERALWDGIR